ncbi:MAG TPA: tetratricopeptide repeat protein [Opitutaceae bacterium]|jgi:tetratricopeptide (TPR) repeat protein|nr:tetratricopeptide repeat protein [Opitutaceae bacterium]
MPVTTADSQGRAILVRTRRLLAAAAIAVVAATVAAYSRSFTVPFLYDDIPTIVQNPSIRHLATAFVAPDNTTSGGRPILNLSLALDYWISGTSVQGYHVANLAIHVAAALVLLGIVRRTLIPLVGPAGLQIAFAAALLWAVHPLQTEAVTYVVQRAESLMGLFYLLTLYAFIRSAAPSGRHRGFWTATCIGCCLLGMGTKEVMVSAPVIVLLYDRTFVSGTFREAIHRRGRLYAALFATWIPLALLVISSHGRGGTAGTAAGLPWWRYSLAQFHAVTHYLWLAVWGGPLVFDYGTAIDSPPLRFLRDFAVVAILAVATLWALVRRPAAGFLGACFFAILAPSSSIVPVATETMAEHRMYLPLAAVVVAVVLLLHRWTGRAMIPLCLVFAAALTAATFLRNADYRSELSIWKDTVAKAPENERAHANLGGSYLALVDLDHALNEYSAAQRLKPEDAEIQNDLGNLCLNMPGGLAEATAHFEEAIRIRPGYAEAHNNLANALARTPGRIGDATTQLMEAVRLSPGDADMHESLGSAWMAQSGHAADAASEFEAAARLAPDNALHFFDLGNALMGMPGKREDAIRAYQEAVRLKPAYAQAHNNLGYALMDVPGDLAAAESEFRAAIRIRKDYPRAHLNLGIALGRDPARVEEAATELREVLRLQPDNDEARRILSTMPPAR